MAFTLEAPFLVYGTPGGVAICEQEGSYYLARLEPVYEVGPVECTSLGPYATYAEAMEHLGEMPPPLAPVPPPPPPDEEPPA